MTTSARVREALDLGVDAEVFERCAVALLSRRYQNVEPVEGGSDGGRDADIYGPIAGDQDSRGRILVTTGDLLDNLKSSQRTWQKIRDSGESFRVDQLVMATHAPLSDAKRRNILRHCVEHGLPVPQFWSRDWLVEELRNDVDWRVELTGVRGRLEALTDLDKRTADLPAVVGRAEECQALQELVEAHTNDVMLVGLPGVGKSRVVAELSGRVHVVEVLASDYLGDDLVAVDPAAVVLDDAHLHLDILRQLAQLRIREQLGFQILAVLWPGSETEARQFLREPDVVVLDRLPREEVDEIVRKLGVQGVRARHAILEQADGRPGWATVLAELVVSGDGEQLTEGQYLLDRVSALSRSVAGTAALNDALACIAALGRTTIEDLETIADLVHVAQADLVDWLSAAAQGGMVARTGDAWTVFPALQPLLAASWFFGERKSRRWSTVVERFDGDTRLDRTLLEIADLVPGPEARDLADMWFSNVESSAIVTEGDLSLVTEYAQIDEPRADRASALARRVLAEEREPETTMFGRTFDPVGEAAASVLEAAFRRTCSREAIRGLFDLVVDGDARSGNLDRPSRVIKELTHYLDPDIGAVSQLRERIFRYVLEWFDERPDQDRWTVLSQIAKDVFDPHVEGAWMDPGSHRAFTFAQGLDGADSLAALVESWAEIDQRVRYAPLHSIPHAAVAHLCEVFRIWSALATGGAVGRVEVSEHHQALALDGSHRVLRTLEYLAPAYPAIPIRVNRQLDLVTRWNNGPIGLQELPILDDRIARFAGIKEFDVDTQDWMERRQAEQDSLATEVAALGPMPGVAEFQRLVTEMRVLDTHHEGEWVASMIAEHADDLRAWLDVAIELDARPLIGPFLARARNAGIDVAAQMVRLLEQPSTRVIALRVFLRATGQLDDLAERVLASMVRGDARALGDFLWTTDEATPTLRAMLVHPLAELRALAAVSFGEAMEHGPPVPDDLRDVWRSALLDADPQELPQHAQWRLEQTLEHSLSSDPELCAEWFIANAQRPSNGIRVRRSIDLLPAKLRSLPRDQRRRVAVALGSDALLENEYASDLLGHDEEFAAGLLAEGVVDSALLLRSLSGYRDATIEAIAPVLIAADVPPETIARRALRIRETVGSVAESIRGDITFFADLAERRPELLEVCKIATNMLRVDLDDAVAEERMDRLAGW
jgi:hypothetical protein